jgi:hypothetical protein
VNKPGKSGFFSWTSFDFLKKAGCIVNFEDNEEVTAYGRYR